MISKVKKINFLLRLIFVLASFFFFPFQASATPTKKTEEDPYRKLMQLYSEYIRLEEVIFSKLSFELSPDQLVKTGSGLKLTLLDNFKRPWIFRPSPQGSFGEYREIVGYRIYKLFGLNSPETHGITLMLNNKTEKGSIQRYVEHLPRISRVAGYRLAPAAIDYLLKAQTLDWLLKSYDARFNNFIVLSREKGVVDGLCRVDLESSLSEGQGAYNYDSMIYESKEPWFKKENISYYSVLQDYNSGKIDIAWKTNLPFVEFVADLPDDFFKFQILPVKTGIFSSSGVISAKNAKFLTRIIRMKKNLRNDFQRFYDGLVKGPRGGGRDLLVARNDEINKACDNLSQRLEELKNEETRVRMLVPGSTKIEARVCVEGYKIAYRFRSDCASLKKGWEAEFDRGWRRLSELEEQAATEIEKEAIRYYKQQMRNLRSGKNVELAATEIALSLIEEQKSNQIDDNVISYSELVALHKRYFALQEELFQRLTFKLSAEQVVKDGTAFKLTLEDNLGKKWIFKEKKLNKINAQKLYTLFGLDTPEIHKVRLVLNGKLSTGTLQEFIPARSTLSSYSPANISAAGLEYLMKTQVVDWLMMDYDANSSNFLVFSSDERERADKLMRIDQDCACLDYKASDFDYKHMIAIDKNPDKAVADSYYCRLEDAYQKKEIDLDLERAYSFVSFIANFPEPQFKEVIKDLKIQGKNSQQKNIPAELKKKNKFLRNLLLLNKRKALEGFRKLYFNLAMRRSAKVDFSKKIAGSDDLKEAYANLKNKLNRLEKENNRINKNPKGLPVQISAVASLDGFRVMFRIYEVCWSRNGDLEKECREALITLAMLGSNAQPNEQEAINLYMQEVRKIQSGRGMTYPVNQLNKLIDPVFSPGERKPE